MSSLTQVAVHASAFPGQLEQGLLRSLRARKIDPKFHYVSHKQAGKWLALHEAHSPARYDENCAGIYDQSFLAAAKILNGQSVHVISLGCGGGQKDARLVQALAGQGRVESYTPMDISLALVLTSLQRVAGENKSIPAHPLVCDLSEADDLTQSLDTFLDPATPRVFGFFGMIPNFEPELILPKLASLVRLSDYLLFSANLAPGEDYTAGVQKVLPGYNNALTADWLTTFLDELGVGQGEGTLEFSVEETASGLQRIVADYFFQKQATITVHGEKFVFIPGEKMRLFFSYRYTPKRVQSLLAEYQLRIVGQWVADSEEEGAFLVQRNALK